MRTKIYHEIIQMLPAALQAEIEARGYTVPEMDLLRIVYFQAGSLSEQLRYFQLLQEEGCSGEARENARCIREHLAKNAAEFAIGAANVVYELCIRDRPDHVEEKYLCATLEDALGAIAQYYALYPGIALESGLSRYRIVKRKILGACDTLQEDILGECECRAGGVLYRVMDTHRVVCHEDISCENCEKICVCRVKADPWLPKYLKDGDIVSFDQNGKTMFGYNIDLDLYNDAALPKDPSFASEYYIIPLYEDGGDYDSWALFDMHHHVTAGLVLRAKASQLSKQQAEAAERIRAFVRGHMKKIDV